MASNPKSRGTGCKFTIVEIKHLLEVVEEVVPIGLLSHIGVDRRIAKAQVSRACSQQNAHC
jgi:hypothetical protein